MKKTPLTLLCAAMLIAAASVRPVHAAGPGDSAKPVQNQKLPDVPGKKLVMAVVSYEPGGVSEAHRHQGSVFAYVLEGEIVSQLGDGPEITYKAGESWYEPPLTPHRVSRNASATQPAKLLAVLVLDEGAPIKEPLPK
jgi:quercetin dioxygenase-like cupin family protein